MVVSYCQMALRVRPLFVTVTDKKKKLRIRIKYLNILFLQYFIKYFISIPHTINHITAQKQNTLETENRIRHTKMPKMLTLIRRRAIARLVHYRSTASYTQYQTADKQNERQKELKINQPLAL